MNHSWIFSLVAIILIGSILIFFTPIEFAYANPDYEVIVSMSRVREGCYNGQSICFEWRLGTTSNPNYTPYPHRAEGVIEYYDNDKKVSTVTFDELHYNNLMTLRFPSVSSGNYSGPYYAKILSVDYPYNYIGDGDVLVYPEPDPCDLVEFDLPTLDLTGNFLLGSLLPPAFGEDPCPTTFTSVKSGDWSSSDTWKNTHGNRGTPFADDKKTIMTGHIVTVSSSIINSKLIDIAGTLIISGELTNNGNIINFRGTINNEGTINNFGNIYSFLGRINNSGTITNNSGGTIENNGGTINNTGTIINTGTTINRSQGSIANTGTIDNYGILNNKSGASIENNSGNINNYGTINNNFGSIYIYGGTINNFGTINNSNSISNYNYGTITNTGTINNFDRIYNLGTINNLGSIKNSGKIIDCGTYTGTPPSENEIMACATTQEPTVSTTDSAGTSTTTYDDNPPDSVVPELAPLGEPTVSTTDSAGTSSTIVEEDTSSSEIPSDDGTSTTTYDYNFPDPVVPEFTGDLIIIYDDDPEDSVIPELSDPYSTTTYDDGRVVTIDGKGTIHTQYPDGSRVSIYTSGIEVTRLSDDTLDVQYTDGSSVTYLPSGSYKRVDSVGNAVWTLHNGVIITISFDGVVTRTYPDTAPFNKIKLDVKVSDDELSAFGDVTFTGNNSPVNEITIDIYDYVDRSFVDSKTIYPDSNGFWELSFTGLDDDNYFLTISTLTDSVDYVLEDEPTSLNTSKSELGSISINDRTFDTTKLTDRELIISGEINDYESNSGIMIEIKKPDGTTTQKSLAIKDGQFDYKIMMDETWESGRYSVVAIYQEKNISEISFSVKDTTDEISTDSVLSEIKPYTLTDNNIEKYSLPKYKETSQIDVSGTVSEYKRGEHVVITITLPDGTTEDRAVMASKQGSYNFPYQLTHSMPLGKYTISVKYADKEIETFTIELVSKLVPEWIKSNAGWWADGEIDDNTFVQGIQFLIKEKILLVSGQPQLSGASEGIPDWVKNNAGWWADGNISDGDFINGIKYMIEHGIIKVS